MQPLLTFLAALTSGSAKLVLPSPNIMDTPFWRSEEGVGASKKGGNWIHDNSDGENKFI